MPNHCTNYLRVSGHASEVKRFHDAITQAGDKQDHEDFRILDNLFPTPKELSETPKGSFGEGSEKQIEMEAKNKANLEKFGSPDWYHWNCKNYGSKWSDFDGCLNEYSGGLLKVVFMSAWSPIVEGIRNVSKQFPTLDFILTYEEGGMAFLGGAGIKNGEIVGEIEGEYPSMGDDCDDDDYEAHYEKVTDLVVGIEKALETVF
jgi:hypothetical protein